MNCCTYVISWDPFPKDVTLHQATNHSGEIIKLFVAASEALWSHANSYRKAKVVRAVIYLSMVFCIEVTEAWNC